MATNNKPLEDWEKQDVQGWFNNHPALQDYASCFQGLNGPLLARLKTENFVRIVTRKAGELGHEPEAIGAALCLELDEYKKAPQQGTHTSHTHLE